MQLSKAVAFSRMAMVLALWLAANVAQAQNPITATNPPVWTDILTATGQTNMASGDYFAIGSTNSGSDPTEILKTDLASILPTANTLALAPNITTLSGANVGTFTCGTASFPKPALTALESFSSSGSGGIFGIGFEGTFNSPSGGLPTVNSIFEAVFFNENQCYTTNGTGGGDESNANGREYGFFLDTYNNTIWAYWGTMENVNTAQVQVELTTCPNGPGACSCPGGTACTAPSGSGTATQVSCSSGLSSCSLGTNMQTVANGATSPVAGQEYFYEIYPFLTNATPPANCSFKISIFSSNNTVTPVYTAIIPVNGGPTANTVGITGVVTAPSNATPITGSDSNFCNVIASTGGDTGFASANVNPGSATTPPGVTLPSPSQMNVYMQRLFVGKN
jgi:hypothetical protein